MEKVIKGSYGGQELEISTGKMAKQAGGAVIVRLNDNIVLVTATASPDPVEGQDFFPLTVDYREKTFATGKIPGGFFKREGRPKDREILISRLIDRPIRPLFPEGFVNETQIIASLFSADGKYDTDILAVIGASASLAISNIPFEGPVGAARVAIVDSKIIPNPTYEDLENAELDLVLAGTESTVTTIEASADEVSEEQMLEAIEAGHKLIKESIQVQKELIAQLNIVKMEYKPYLIDAALKARVTEAVGDSLNAIDSIRAKQERNEAFRLFVNEIKANLEEEFPEQGRVIAQVIDDLRKEKMRRSIAVDGVRLDGRSVTDIRNITCEAGILPRTHGSGLFTRGETQSLSVLTLGTSSDEQITEELVGETSKTFMLHYNFPPFSVGEVRFMRGPGRREIGHGYLAEKALSSVIPSEEIFPYTIRIVSEILESNGSSSMATVCAGSISLMDAGVPIKEHVAGIAMGLIEHDNGSAILSDIMGEEDHYGDMDFKVAGTKQGITSLQLDTKVQGIDIETLRRGFEQAKAGRMHILDKLYEVISEPRSRLSQYAPRLVSFMIDKEKIGAVIGPGGKSIRGIIEETGVKIDIDDDGKVTIASSDMTSLEAAKKRIDDITRDIEVGEIYEGKVVRITNFGAFIELLPGKDGMMHISEYAYERTNALEDVIKIGDILRVKVIKVDESGKYGLSRKVLLEKPEGYEEKKYQPREKKFDRKYDRNPHSSNRKRYDKSDNEAKD